MGDFNGAHARRVRRMDRASFVGWDLGVTHALDASHGVATPGVCELVPSDDGALDLKITIPFNLCPYTKRKYRRAWYCGYMDGVSS